MAKWYCTIDSLTFLRVWDETGTEMMTYHSRLAMDKRSQRAGMDDLVKRLYLENKKRKWKTAIVYDNRTKQQLAKWVDKIRIE
jgi:hypothetical protein